MSNQLYRAIFTIKLIDYTNIWNSAIKFADEMMNENNENNCLKSSANMQVIFDNIPKEEDLNKIAETIKNKFAENENIKVISIEYKVEVVYGKKDGDN